MTDEREKYSLKQLREKRKMTQKTVANDLGISVSTYRSWEKDLSRVSVHTAIALADYFGIRLGQFFICQ